MPFAGFRPGSRSRVDRPGRRWRRRSAGHRSAATLQFRAQEIASDFGVGYAVAPGDVNGDGRTDILAISGTELVWFQAPTWEKNVILGAGATTADNVTLAPHDIDGDGRLDVALGAAGPARTPARCSGSGRTHPAPRRPGRCSPSPRSRRCTGSGGRTSMATGSLELIVAPLHGKGAKGPDWDGPGARVLVFRPPANPQDRPVADGGGGRGQPHPAQLPAP